ncbi:MAG: DUF4007 family protein [Lachnospiraceae bacterium]|nr:DUF4007 family protein [Lachnospiraceae bacterium]
MAENITKNSYRYKGHESFVLRDGWLTKGLCELAESDGEDLFKNYYGADRLGVGPNMAKAIRYWMEVAGLLEVKSGKAKLTQLGRIISDNDRYIEDSFTLWLLHVQIATNKAKATAWYQFFSEFEMDEFSKEDLKEVMQSLALLLCGQDKAPSMNSVIADCEAILQMYAKEKSKEADPEEKKKSPFFALGLVRAEGEKYRKAQPAKNNLDRNIVWMCINKACDDKSISIDELASGPVGPGKVLNMKRAMISEYIDELVEDGKVDVNRTAGLDMVYIKKPQSIEEIAREYYNNRK